ncbi:ribonuclease H-like domain-containing protein, partial [Crassisporium funariophilum]
IKHHLAPLAIAANVTQSSHCRLDDVLITFATLEMEYKKLTDPIECGVRDAVLASIERRWAKSDQDVFIAAIILNPFLKLAPLKRDPRLISMGSIMNLLSRLWTRFYSVPCPTELYEELRNYIGNHEVYQELPTVCSTLKATAASKNQSPDPLRAYEDIMIVGFEPTPLIRLAIHILSICPNSASCERLFSTFGLILTKLRTRLGKKRVVDLAECKMHVRDEHMRNNTQQHLRKRT